MINKFNFPRQYLAVLFVAIAVTLNGCFNAENLGANVGGTNSGYQHDADLVRLHNLVKIGEWIEEYKEKSGKYPFEGDSDLPIYTFIATELQRSYITEKPPFEILEKNEIDLEMELEKVLQRDIEIPFDPQNVPVNKPVFYIYVINGKTYNFAVHLFQDFNFARKIAEFYNKLEISNYSNPERGIWKLKDLISNDDFIDVFNERPIKKDFFDEYY